MDTAYSLQIYENCGEKATFSFFLKKEEKNPNGKAWNGENRGEQESGRTKRKAESGKGKRTRSAGIPEMENGAGAEGKGRMPEWNTRHGTPEALPHEAAGKAATPITGTALRPDTENPAPDKGGINPQIRGVRRFRIRNGVPCRKQPQDTGRA